MSRPEPTLQHQRRRARGPSRQRPSGVHARPLLPVIIVLLLALAAACGADSGSPSTPPVLVPGSPPPDGADLDLGRAAALYRDGFFEDAIAIYSAAAQHGQPEQRREALWSLARLRHQRGEMRAAQQAVTAFLDEDPGADARARALLLKGSAALAAGDSAGAREAFQEYLRAGGPAAPYARLSLARVSAWRGQFVEAIKHIEDAQPAELPPSARTTASFALAGYYEQAGRPDDAAAAYQRISAEAPAERDRAEALWQLSQLAYTGGDDEASRASLQDLIRRYPWHERSLQALAAPQLVRPGVTPREEALVLFHHRANDAAADAFTAIAAGADPSPAGEARYYLGILAERRGAPADALLEYDLAVELLTPGGDRTLLARAHWDRGTVLESLGRTEDAVADYTAAAEASPGWQGAREALFRAGLLRLRQGWPGEALSLWQRYEQGARDREDRARAAFWAAAAHDALGDPDAARQSLEAAAAAPLDYYGLRAAALLAPASEFPDIPHASPRQPAWGPAERALRRLAGAEDPLARRALLEGPAWQRAMELLRSGLRDEAEQEFLNAIDQSAASPWLLYRIARSLADEGLYPISARAGARLVAALPEVPPVLLTLAHPPAYLELAAAVSREEAFSPYLLLALVRQESLYQPDAVSPAKAMGLTQVMPATAAEIAAQLEEEPFLEKDLLRPAVSLRFGAHYLAQQLERFGGEIGPALAAYNGGPGNALRWREAAGSDPDMFLETIDFKETRAYVELVLENYALYLYAYGLVPAPALPLPGGDTPA